MAVQLAPAATVVFAGQAKVGGVWSAAVTVNEQVDVLPAASVALRVMVCVPMKSAPASGTCVSFGLAEQLSEAVTDAA